MSDFDKEIERILNQVYNDPIPDTKGTVKSAVVKTEYRYIEYLEQNGLIKRLKNVHSGGRFGIQLENKGYEVFETYGGWKNYKRKVIDEEKVLDRAQARAIKYWWLPVIISILALLVAILALFVK